MRNADNLPPSCAVATKYGNLKFLEPFWPVQACDGTALPLSLDALISQIYFWNKILHVSNSSSVHHQEFFTVHRAVVYSVQCKTLDDGQRNCPKHVEFYSKNKCDKSVHLVGFIIRIYHDARSPERQIFVRVHIASAIISAAPTGRISITFDIRLL